MQLTCPHCGFSREIPTEKIPPKATLATCPKCLKKFNFREPAADPIDILFEPEPTVVEPEPEPEPMPELEPMLTREQARLEDPPHPASGTDTGMDVPWESLNKYGILPGFYQTILRVMKTPIQLFKAMPLGSGIGRPLIFYLILAEVEILSQFFWNTVGLTGALHAENALYSFSEMGLSSLMVLFFYPFFLTLGVFLGTAVIHLCLRLLKGAGAGYEGTFKAVTYGSAPMILSVIPLAGQIAGAVWALATTIIAYKYIHKTTYSKVILAIILPAGLLLVVTFLVVAGRGI
jgi:predicted Zn finger-like uncharacterized protein